MAPQGTSLEELFLPHVCCHDEALELSRANVRDGRADRLQPKQCPKCGHALPAEQPLRASDVPGVAHAAVFYATFFVVFIFHRYSHIHADISMWVAWFVSFAVCCKLSTPLRSARSALLIIFLFDLVVVYLRFLRWLPEITFEQIAGYATISWLVACIAVTPIFAAYGMRRLIACLRRRAQERNDNS